MRYRIIKDDVKPVIFQAQRWDGYSWIYVHGTTTFSHGETRNALKSLAKAKPKVVEEIEL